MKSSIEGNHINLKSPEGYRIFQDYYKTIRQKLKRNSDNSVVLPVMVLFDDSDQIVGIAQTLDEVKVIAS